MNEQVWFIWLECVARSGQLIVELFQWSRKQADAGPLGVYTSFQKVEHEVADMMNPIATALPVCIV